MPVPSPASRPDLTVRCADASGAVREGAVVDLLGTSSSPSRLVVGFPAGSAPRLAVGGLAELELGGAALAEPVRADAQVVYCAREGNEEVYQFAVSGPLAASIDVLVGRRRSFRVQPDEPIEVELTAGSGSAVGRIADLSIYGASIAIERGEESELSGAWTVRVRFRLPGDEEEVELGGSVQFRKLAGDTVRLGVQFDPRATVDYAATEHRVAGYVLGRQTEVLRAMIDRA